MVILDLALALGQPGKKFGVKTNFELDVAPDAIAPNKIVGNADVSLSYFVDDQSVVNMSGYVKFPCELICDRCGASIERNLFLDYSEQIDLNDEDQEFIYNQTKLKLDYIISSFVLLNFPSKILCRDDCKGLCRTCGSNLNDGKCMCNKSMQ